MTPELANAILGTVFGFGFTLFGYLIRARGESERFRAQVEAEVERRLQVERETARQNVTRRVAATLAVIRSRYDESDECGPACAYPISQRDS